MIRPKDGGSLDGSPLWIALQGLGVATLGFLWLVVIAGSVAVVLGGGHQ